MFRICLEGIFDPRTYISSLWTHKEAVCIASRCTVITIASHEAWPSVPSSRRESRSSLVRLTNTGAEFQMDWRSKGLYDVECANSWFIQPLP